ncbi:MAG: hypothetical protein WC346_12795 [Methanogenium sp.]|jgi:hypothetical protein
MKKIIIIIIAVFLIAGCCTSQIRPVCRHQAAASCFAAHEKGYQAFIAFGPVIGSLEWHAQAFILVKGKQQWLDNHSKPGTQDKFIPKKIYSYREYLSYLLSH